jgi:predicted dehydrogenase
VNSAHAYWVERALERRLHVVVDKPAFTSLRDAERLAELAAKRNLCLAESTVYACHPQIELLRRVFADAGSTPTRLTATFSFPPLDPSNFRYTRELGGGALWDLGPYAVTPGRLLFGQEPDRVFCWARREPEHEVETAFSLLATYAGGRSMVGHFGFDTEYRNQMTVLGPRVSVDVDRVFTTPADMENELRVRTNNVETTLRVPAADHFCLFLQAVADAVGRGDHQSFVRDLVMDATVLHRLRAAAHSA